MKEEFLAEEMLKARSIHKNMTFEGLLGFSHTIVHKVTQNGAIEKKKAMITEITTLHNCVEHKSIIMHKNLKTMSSSQPKTGI